jgi:Arc/MetJ-type ribon-helix-helix transcriptional regulator
MIDMVNGMATTTKFTITLDNEQFEEMRRIVAAGRTPSVSAFVKRAVETALHDAAGWREMLDAALDASGGPMTPAERAWADEVLGHGRSRTRGTRGHS